MVTRILFDPRTDNLDGTQAALQAVTIEATPTGIREDGSVFILPSTLTFATTTGAAPILLSAPSASTAWRLAVKNAGQLRQTRIVRFPDVPSITWAALTDVDPASLGTTPGHARQWDATFAELVTLIGSGGSGYLPLWKANTAYTAAQFVVSPTGQIIQANATFTSGSTYNATNWTVVTGGGGGAVSSVAGRTGAVTLTAADVALGNVNNTSDAAKPISSAQAAVNAAKADLVGGLVPTSQIPALALNTSVTVASQAAMLALTTTQVQPGDLAIRTDGAGTFILTATDPTQLANWTRLNAPTDVVTSVNGQTGTVVLAKADVGLGSVDNTADTAKPVSTAQQAALDLKAPLAAPSFTGLANFAGAASVMGGLRLINRTVTASGAITLADIGVVSTATTPITLTLPASSNAFLMIKNQGTQPLTIAAPSTGTNPSIDGAASVVVAVGDQAILSGLSFTLGTWMVVSGAQAATIAGKLDALAAPVTLTTSSTMTAGAWNLIDATSGPLTVTLPTPTKIGQRLIAERQDAGTNLISFAGTVRGLTSGLPTFPGVGVRGESIDFEAESLTSWRIIASHKPKALLDQQFAGLASPALTGTPTVPTAAPGISSTQVASTAFVKTALVATSAEVRALAAVVIDPTPPTITVQTGGGTPAGATSTLTGTIFKYDDTTNRCRYNGFRFEPRPWSGINIYAPRPPHTTDSKELTAGGLIGSLWTIDFDFYGDAFEICVVDSTQVRVITDGKYAQDAPVLGGGSGNFFFIKVQYATTAYRRVRIETGLNAANSLPGGWVHGIKFKTGQAHFAPSMPNTKRLALVHDSYGAGGLPTTADLRGYSAFLSRILGFTDYMNHCISGSGFTIGSTGNSQKYLPRADDLAVAQPDYLLIMASVNDYSNRATTLATEAAAFFTACKTQLPNTRILCVGAMGMVQSNNDAINAVLSPVAATAGIEFLDTTGLAASLPAGLIGSDNYHPTVDGHQWIARQLGALIASRWQLPR